MLGTNVPTNDKYKLHNATVQAISWGVVDFSTKVGTLWLHIVYMVYLVETQVLNRLYNIFYLWCQYIDVSDQAIFLINGYGPSWWWSK